MSRLLAYRRALRGLTLYGFVKRVIRSLIRRAGLVILYFRDMLLPTYAINLRFKGSLHTGSVIPPDSVLHAKEPVLSAEVAKRFLGHKLDLLGSGWTDIGHGIVPKGLEGHRFIDKREIKSTGWQPTYRSSINRSNRAESKRICDMIFDGGERFPGYSWINWHRDMKSGYQWSISKWYAHNKPAPVVGADIKVPWELGRMQHLPSLALTYAQWKARAEGAKEERYAVIPIEFRRQVLDFIASNPPRFGPQWRSPLEVAIRATNILIAFDVFHSCGEDFDRPFLSVLERSIWEHGFHLIRNLEWHPHYRGNHYLGNIAGLIFIASYLPRSPQVDAWLAFAVQELIAEVRHQFLEDGGHFEYSTGYHRFCAEMAIYATALVLGLPDDKKQALEDYNYRLLKTPKPLAPGPMKWYSLQEQLPPSDPCKNPFPPDHFQRLSRSIRIVHHAEKADGTVPQIGDFDSGRFLKLFPRYEHLEISTESCDPQEQHLDQQHLYAAAAGLMDIEGTQPVDERFTMERALVRSIVGGISIKPPSLDEIPWTSDDVGVFNAVCEQTRHLPGFKKTVVPLPDCRAVRFSEYHAYPDFGLYVLRAKSLFCSVRCGTPDPQRQNGHAHDDNLSVEVAAGDKPLITDPGSYVYTPLPEKRNMYRSWRSHFVPRALEGPHPRLDCGLFFIEFPFQAKCLYFGELGFVGKLKSAEWTIYRVLYLGDGALIIEDACDSTDHTLIVDRNISIATTKGYGIATERPVCSF